MYLEFLSDCLDRYFTFHKTYLYTHWKWCILARGPKNSRKLGVLAKIKLTLTGHWNNMEYVTGRFLEVIRYYNVRLPS